MAYRELVKEWHRGVLALEKDDWESALRIFGCIENPTSKIDFNIGCIHLVRGDLEHALEAFEQTVSKDCCLAVGFYQRGYVCLRLQRYEEALNDCRLALTHLRNNSCIDYKQLGLKVVLCAWEVLYNTAAALCRLGDWQVARQTLEEAIGQAPKGQIPNLDVALEQVQEQVFLEPRSIPQGEFFRPQKKDVDELESKDFLGQPKVISSAFEEDQDSGFPRLHSQGGYKSGVDPSCKRFHGSLCPAGPYAREENALQTTSASHTSSAGPDSHATVVYEERKVGPGLPLPPGKVPPNKVHERQMVQFPGPAERKTDKGDTNTTKPGTALESSLALEDVAAAQREEAPHHGGRPMLLKVHGSYIANIKLSVAPSLADLRALLQEECRRQAEQMVLGFRPPGSNELILIHSNKELRNVWQGAEGGHLTLWSQSKEDRPVLYQMVARHSYTAQGPEDLNFKEGDTLEILSEVNEEWLEGCCSGTVGIFPKCFAVRDGASAAPS